VKDEVRFKIKTSLPYNDMKVLNSLLKENFVYLTILLKFKNCSIEFDNLYSISLEILNLLSQTGQTKINVYQKLQKLKFMELKFQSLRISGSEVNYSEANALLDEMEKIQSDPTLSNYITELDISSVQINKAFIKFCVCDFYLAEEYALTAMEILEKYTTNIHKNTNNNLTKKYENEEKYIKKLIQVQEFLAELYDLQKDYPNALSSYEKCYYLYIGRYGINHPLIEQIKKKKELFEKKVDNMKIENNMSRKDEDFITSFKGGKIYNSKGKTDTYSFMIPVTKIVEPLLVSIYALPESPYVENNNDYYAYDLFLKNIYFDKNKLFKYLGITEGTYENYMLYTDDALNLILNKIEVINNNYIRFIDPTLYNVSINC
jgi:hypothetical protein